MPDIPSPLFPADNPAVIAHVNLLQGIINRLANNSASCKTWCLTLVGALLSLAGATHTPSIASVALVPVVIFGFVDMMYLAQEKAYRALYARIVTGIRQGSYPIANAFDARAEPTLTDIGWALLSWSVLPIYGGLIVVYIAAVRCGWLDLLGAAAKS
jgi:hypothetical protein